MNDLSYFKLRYPFVPSLTQILKDVCCPGIWGLLVCSTAQHINMTPVPTDTFVLHPEAALKFKSHLRETASQSCWYFSGSVSLIQRRPAAQGHPEVQGTADGQAMYTYPNSPVISVSPNNTTNTLYLVLRLRIL